MYVSVGVGTEGTEIEEEGERMYEMLADKYGLGEHPT